MKTSLNLGVKLWASSKLSGGGHLDDEGRLAPAAFLKHADDDFEKFMLRIVWSIGEKWRGAKRMGSRSGVTLAEVTELYEQRRQSMNKSLVEFLPPTPSSLLNGKI